MTELAAQDAPQIRSGREMQEREKTIRLLDLTVLHFTDEEKYSRVKGPKQGCGWGVTL